MDLLFLDDAQAFLGIGCLVYGIAVGNQIDLDKIGNFIFIVYDKNVDVRHVRSPSLW